MIAFLVIRPVFEPHEDSLPRILTALSMARVRVTGGSLVFLGSWADSATPERRRVGAAIQGSFHRELRDSPEARSSGLLPARSRGSSPSVRRILPMEALARSP
jgi:hypothetical protein